MGLLGLKHTVCRTGSALVNVLTYGLSTVPPEAGLANNAKSVWHRKSAAEKLQHSANCRPMPDRDLLGEKCPGPVCTRSVSEISNNNKISTLQPTFEQSQPWAAMGTFDRKLALVDKHPKRFTLEISNEKSRTVRQHYGPVAPIGRIGQTLFRAC